MSLALDGSVQGSAAFSGTTISCTLTTSNTNDIIVLISDVYFPGGGSQTNSITTTGGLTWTKRTSFTGSNGVSQIDVWYAKAASALSSVTFTMTLGAATGAATLNAFGVSGADQTTIWDSNGSLPATNGAAPSDPVSLSTTNTNTFIFATFSMANTGSPTSGSGWTQIIGGSSFLVEYLIASTAQSGLSATIGTGVSNSNAAVCDAIFQTPVGGGYVPYNPWPQAAPILAT